MGRRLGIGLVVAGVALLTVAGVWRVVASGGRSSRGPSVTATPIAVRVKLARRSLRLAHLRPSRCAAHGGRIVCLLADGGRCVIDAHGSGTCAGAPGLGGVRLQVVTETVTSTPLSVP